MDKLLPLFFITVGCSVIVSPSPRHFFLRNLSKRFLSCENIISCSTDGSVIHCIYQALISNLTCRTDGKVHIECKGRRRNNQIYRSSWWLMKGFRQRFDSKSTTVMPDKPLRRLGVKDIPRETMLAVVVSNKRQRIYLHKKPSFRCHGYISTRSRDRTVAVSLADGKLWWLSKSGILNRHPFKKDIEYGKMKYLLGNENCFFAGNTSILLHVKLHARKIKFTVVLRGCNIQQLVAILHTTLLYYVDVEVNGKWYIKSMTVTGQMSRKYLISTGTQINHLFPTATFAVTCKPILTVITLGNVQQQPKEYDMLRKVKKPCLDIARWRRTFYLLTSGEISELNLKNGAGSQMKTTKLGYHLSPSDSVTLEFAIIKKDIYMNAKFRKSKKKRRG